MTASPILSHPRLAFRILLLALTGSGGSPGNAVRATEAAADWPTHRADIGRTGQGVSELALPLHPAWTFEAVAPRPAWGLPARRSYWQRLERIEPRVVEDQFHPVVLADDALLFTPEFANLVLAESDLEGDARHEVASGRRLGAAGQSAGDWRLVRPGHSCGTLSGAGDCLFFRANNPTVLDLRAHLERGTAAVKLAPSRARCWINMIPAGGLLLIPEASAGCVCQYSLQTSMAFRPGFGDDSLVVGGAGGEVRAP